MQTIAIILAAGRGKRLYPYTKNLPKCLVNVGGVPILQHQLKALATNEIKRVVVVTGFMYQKVEKFAKENFSEIKFTFVRNCNYKTNTLYSLALAAEKIGQQKKNHILQINGDAIFHPKIITKMIKVGQSRVAVRYGKCGVEEIKAEVDGNNYIKALNKNINPKLSIGEAIGINKFKPDFWNALRSSLNSFKNIFKNEYFEFAIEDVIEIRKLKIKPFDIGALRAVEIDFPKDLAVAKKLIKQL